MSVQNRRKVSSAWRKIVPCYQLGEDFGRRVTARLAVASAEGQLGLQIILEVCRA